MIDAYHIESSTIFIADMKENIVFSIMSEEMEVACADFTAQEIYKEHLILHVPCDMTSFEEETVNVYKWIDDHGE